MIRCLLSLLIAASAVHGLAAQGPDPKQQLATEIAFLEARVNRDPEDPVTPTRLGQAYLRQARETGEFAAFLRAAKTFELALTRAKDHVGAIVGLAQARAAAHRFDDALTLGERAIALNPAAPDGYAIVGDAALELGRLDRAQAMYEQMAKLAPGYHVDTRMANLAAARGDVNAAYAALERASRDAAQRGMSEDLRAWGHVRGGSIAFDRGDFARAEKSYDAALQLTPQSYAALEHMAELRAAQGRADDALLLYSKAIALSPQPEFHEAVGRIHAARGYKELARAAFDKARTGYERASAEGDPGAYRGLALFYADVEPRPQEAVTWARKDLELRRDAVTYGVLAWALLKAGSAKDAATAAQQAIDQQPVDAATWYRAGVVAMANGNTDAARTRLQRSLEINPRSADADDARARLETLKPKR